MKRFENLTREEREQATDLITKALEEFQDGFGYSVELTRLVDGESTYTLTYSDGAKYEYTDIDGAYAHIRETRSRLQAFKVLGALEG